MSVGQKTTESEKQAKINSIHIDFYGDTELPRLNKETLEEFGFNDEPVLLKKNIVEKNIKSHPEVEPSEYKDIIGNALYKPDRVLHGGGDKSYYNFISRTGENKNAVSLLQVKNTNSGSLEIVNIYRIDDKGVKKKEHKAKK